MGRHAPVVQAADWDDLIAAVCAHPAGAPLRAATRGTAQGVLAAPAAIARWLAQSGAVLNSSLRLLVIGAEKLDAVDEGRWYQLLPALLGCEMSITVTLVGDRLNRRFDSPLYPAAPAVPAHMHVGRLSGYFAATAAPDIDLAFLFHPGFQKHRGWLEDGSLARLQSLGVPVVSVSYEADEAELEGWVVGCHGFEQVDAPVLNPFYIDFSDAASRVHWGRAMWRFQGLPGREGQPVDQQRLDALDRLGDMVLHSIDLQQPAMASYGQRVALRAETGATLPLIYVFDEFLVDPTDGGLFALRAGALEKIGVLPNADVAAYPGMAATDLARAVWAADIKRRHLLDRYPRRIDADALHRRARVMHADLEGKVEQIFRA